MNWRAKIPTYYTYTSHVFTTSLENIFQEPAKSDQICFGSNYMKWWWQMMRDLSLKFPNLKNSYLNYVSECCRKWSMILYGLSSNVLRFWLHCMRNLTVFLELLSCFSSLQAKINNSPTSSAFVQSGVRWVSGWRRGLSSILLPTTNDAHPSKMPTEPCQKTSENCRQCQTTKVKFLGRLVHSLSIHLTISFKHYYIEKQVYNEHYWTSLQPLTLSYESVVMDESLVNIYRDARLQLLFHICHC